MNLNKLCYAGVCLLLLAGVAFVMNPAVSQDSNDGNLRYSSAGRYGGRDLTPTEQATVTRAINNIGTSPPASITFRDAAGNSKTVSCSTIAADLSAQAKRGDIDAETLNTNIWGVTSSDGKASPAGDAMNVDTSLLGAAGRDSSQSKHLEEVLVHEWKHKTQDSTGTTRAGREIEALAAELAYKDSIGLDTTDRLYAETLSDYQKRVINYAAAQLLRRLAAILETLQKLSTLHFSTVPGGADHYVSFGIGDTASYEFSLAPMRASDFMVFQSYPGQTPGVARVLICGGTQAPLAGQFMGLNVMNGMVIPPPIISNFGTPYPPMFFFAMTKQGEQYYVLDTLGQQIMRVADMNMDLVPDMLQGMYASAFQPGFTMLMGMRGIDAYVHPFLGAGLIVNHEEAHLSHAVLPYEPVWFLPDQDGDQMADYCVQLPMYEFVTIKPHIQSPLPWAGEAMVNVYATWLHPVDIWKTDSLGQIFIEHLGSVTMSSPDAICPLTRPVEAGEYLLAVDMHANLRLKLPTVVVDPTPQGLTMQYDGGMVTLRWNAVPGADHYVIYQAPDGHSYTEIGIAPLNQYLLPLPPDTRGFYRVTAVK